MPDYRRLAALNFNRDTARGLTPDEEKEYQAMMAEIAREKAQQAQQGQGQYQPQPQQTPQGSSWLSLMRPDSNN